MPIGQAGFRAAGNGRPVHRHHRSTARRGHRNSGELLTADPAGNAPVKGPVNTFGQPVALVAQTTWAAVKSGVTSRFAICPFVST